MYMHGGLHGAAVETIMSVQKALAAKGFNPGKIDGIMGPNTKTAIIAFQKANGLTADGIVGPLTSAKLFTAAAPAPATALAKTLATLAPLLSPATAAAHGAKAVASATANVLAKAVAQMKPADAPLTISAGGDQSGSPVPPFSAPSIFPSTIPIAENFPQGSAQGGTAPAAPAQDWLIPALLAAGAAFFLMGKKGKR